MESPDTTPVDISSDAIDVSSVGWRRSDGAHKTAPRTKLQINWNDEKLGDERYKFMLWDVVLFCATASAATSVGWTLASLLMVTLGCFLQEGN